MNTYPFPFLASLAQRDPAFARAAEIALYSLIATLLGTLSDPTTFSWHALAAACVVPLLAYTSKKIRDTNNLGQGSDSTPPTMV